eukprot:gene6206-6921_t
MILTLVSILCLCAATAQGHCQKPTISSETYSTSSVTLSSETVYVVDLKINCENADQEQNFYAEINGILSPVAKSSSDSSKYQISWSSEHKKAVKGDITIKIYDEEGYSAYRKAQRAGDKQSSVSPVGSVVLNHKGARKEGLFVQTEFICTAVALLIWWVANSAKGNVME